MAIAEMTRIIATTMSNSISEKPFWLFMSTPKVLAQFRSASLSNGARTPQTDELYHHKSFAFKQISCLWAGGGTHLGEARHGPDFGFRSKRNYRFRYTRDAYR